MKTYVSSRIYVGSDEINVDGYVHYSSEVDYGADADGARGEKRIFVDEVTNVKGYLDSGEEVCLMSNHLEMAVNQLITRFFEE